MTRRAKIWTVVVAVPFLLAGSLGALYLYLRPSPDLRAFGSISMEWNHVLSTADAETQNRLAERCLEISRQYPGTAGAVRALLLAACNAPETPAGQQAARQFAELIETADIAVLADSFDYGGGRKGVAAEFAPLLLARAHREAGNIRCGGLLAACCTFSTPEEDGAPPAVFKEAADLIADRYAASPDITHFCEILGPFIASPSWASRYERHLRAILAANHDRRVRCAAEYALASVVMAAGEQRQAEAEELFQRFLDDFDGKQEGRNQQIEQMYRDTAQVHVNELQARATGKAAPEIEGLDLNDRPIKLSDFRGRAVLLNFWGSWCFPCMRFVPHERKLAAHYTDRPFAIVGVNCGDEVEVARAAAARTEMTWPSIRNESGDGTAITRQWKILGYPTLYLIDHHGTIRKRWLGSPPPGELRQRVELLVEAAEEHVPADGMSAVAAAMSAPPALGDAQPAPGTAPELPSGTGFIDKVYRETDGTETKYVVFVPPTYDGSEPMPAILYVHGSGLRGADGRQHIEYGLAAAIRARNLNFPFLVVFPQARQDESWLAGTSGGRRSLAILKQAELEYRIDRDRIALTGVSMGGQGTWSLAAADPGRWSAIVPLCHGGDTTTASRLVGIPCWCFHGTDDGMIPPRQSRDMVAAISEAGGRPLYQELPGVGHNDCAARVYAMDDLFEWLLAQNRSRR